MADEPPRHMDTKMFIHSNGQARLALRWEQQIHRAGTVNQSRAAKTACQVIFSGLKWFSLFQLQTLLQSR